MAPNAAQELEPFAQLLFQACNDVDASEARCNTQSDVSHTSTQHTHPATLPPPPPLQTHPPIGPTEVTRPILFWAAYYALPDMRGPSAQSIPVSETSDGQDSTQFCNASNVRVVHGPLAGHLDIDSAVLEVTSCIHLIWLRLSSNPPPVQGSTQ